MPPVPVQRPEVEAACVPRLHPDLDGLDTDGGPSGEDAGAGDEEPVVGVPNGREEAAAEEGVVQEALGDEEVAGHGDVADEGEVGGPL